MVLDQITQYIQENFIYLHPGYTTLNTIVFGIILGMVILLIIRMFRWIDKDPKDLFIPIIHHMCFGSSARALVDNGIYPLTYLLVTPGIYLLTGISAILTLLGSVLIERKTDRDYRYIIFMVGVVMCLPNLYYIQHLDLGVVFQVMGSWVLVSVPFILLGFKWSLLKDKFNLSVLLAHLLDASSTFIAVDYYGYGEQHVLPNALTQMADSAIVMFPLKIAVILPSLYVIDTYVEDKTIRNMLKLAIFILGLAPGLRNFLSLAMGT